MTEKAEKLRSEAQILEQHAEELKGVSSTTGTPWSKFFHEARQARDNYHRQEKAVALAYIDVEEGEVEVSVSKLQKGEYYKDTNADASFSLNLPAFATVEEFSRQFRRTLERTARDKKEAASRKEA